MEQNMISKISPIIITPKQNINNNTNKYQTPSFGWMRKYTLQTFPNQNAKGVWSWLLAEIAVKPYSHKTEFGLIETIKKDSEALYKFTGTDNKIRLIRQKGVKEYCYNVEVPNLQELSKKLGDIEKALASGELKDFIVVRHIDKNSNPVIVCRDIKSPSNKITITKDGLQGSDAEIFDRIDKLLQQPQK